MKCVIETFNIEITHTKCKYITHYNN